MEYLDGFMSVLDDIFSTSRKRHLAGGILLSMAALLGGLALTVITIKRKDDDENDEQE